MGKSRTQSQAVSDANLMGLTQSEYQEMSFIEILEQLYQEDKDTDYLDLSKL